jgi:hypothetical protein
LRARETAALGRELLGGNGILSDFLVAKVLIMPTCLMFILFNFILIYRFNCGNLEFF